MKSTKTLLTTLALVFSFQSLAGETVAPLKVKRENVIKLSDYKGEKTFFEVMTMDSGIRNKLDAAHEGEFTIADSQTVLDARNKFSDKVVRNVLRDLPGNEDNKTQAFADLVDKLEGKKVNQKSLKSMISREGLKPWSIVDFLSMASGSTVLVTLDANNYYYNTSYEAAEVNSGRSFGAGPSHKADDASYPFYLANLRAYFGETEDLAPFYKSIMAILTQSDTSKLSEMSDEGELHLVDNRKIAMDGQTLTTDFVTIYTAELYRHLNSDLEKHDWENALAELTMVSAYSEKAGLVQNMEGEIVKGTPSDWRYVGDQGSGIGGKAGMQRRSFQKKVCKAAEKLHVEALAMIQEVTGKQDDCFRGIMNYLNNFKTQTSVKKNATKLNSAVVKFLSEIRERSDEITAEIK